jgi:phosphatidylglycerol lysyltransferase
VLELTMTKALGAAVATPVLAGALVTYRLLYYVFPFLVAILMLGWRELEQRQEFVKSGVKLAWRGWTALAPRLAALLALGGGFILLLSANTPMEASRRSVLTLLLPLPFLEASHFASSLAGALLIVLARGLQRRIEAAWWLTLVAAAGGMVFSITKGLDWEEALSLGLLLACLLPFRKQFYRQASLWTHRFTLEWWILLFSLAAVATWVGFFTARHVPYQKELWWEFSYEGDAPRFLRAMAGAACLFVVAALAQALRPRRPRVPPPGPPQEVLDALITSSSYAGAALAYLPDKQIMLSENGQSGLMFADQGRSRIVMSDPLGDSSAADDLLWRFVEQAQDEGMRPVFYQVSSSEMPRFVDMGFRLFKLGEEACVPLKTFTLEGTGARKLRQTRSRFSRSGFTFAIWDPATVAARLEELRTISDAWLVEHKAGEKRFSLGCFEGSYVTRFSCAVVLSAAGEAVAFATMWATADHQELTVDMMRHRADASPGSVMESLFVELMLWGQARGYQIFNLGMAPLSGLSSNPLAPLWHRLAARLFHKGGGLYNFQGLRAFKEKFQPEWEPRYIAVQSAWSLPSALLDVTSLIGGGLRRAVGVKRP